MQPSNAPNCGHVPVDMALNKSARPSCLDVLPVPGNTGSQTPGCSRAPRKMHLTRECASEDCHEHVFAVELCTAQNTLDISRSDVSHKHPNFLYSSGDEETVEMMSRSHLPDNPVLSSFSGDTDTEQVDLWIRGPASRRKQVKSSQDLQV